MPNAGLHILYGNPSPENLLGGFILGRAFLKSEALVVLVLWHLCSRVLRKILGHTVAAWINVSLGHRPLDFASPLSG